MGLGDLCPLAAAGALLLRFDLGDSPAATHVRDDAYYEFAWARSLAAGNGPCVTAQFVMGATRVTADHQPVLLQDSQAICTPTGTPLSIVVTQLRVKGK